MTRPTALLIPALVAALAVPTLAEAQATRRGGGSSSGDSDSGTTRSAPSSPAGGSAAPRTAVPRSPAPPPPSASEPQGRSAGVGPSRPQSTQVSGSPARVRSGEVRTTGLSGETTRTRGSRAIGGFAQPRQGTGSVEILPITLWGRGYPWYSSGFSAHFGYYTYDPWFYGSAGWFYPGYRWSDPFGYPYRYRRFGYDPWGYGHHYWGTPYYVGDRGRQDDRDDREYGSLRLRAEPKTARVYIDGALAGTVDDFDGFSNHLALEPGIHHLELRADGYEPYSTEVRVDAGKTRTERASLKRLE